MNRIRLLSEQVANQIAAGEVIERPASVVKELVENALDAQARHITVEIQAGGRSLIRVVDDGIGMNRDDALLCLERHATSKIKSAEDLQSIATMGFRGEALPSIASVSRMTLTTREQESENPEGTRIVIHGGRIVEVKAAGRAPGTTIEVRQLFFNLPARRKFLRSEETERSHIQHYLTLAALAYPETAFTFSQDQRAVWHLPAVAAPPGSEGRVAVLRERLRSIPGSEPRLLEVDFSTTLEAGSFRSGTDPDEAAPLRIWGTLGEPGVSRATREEQHLFVNRRPIENRGLNFALLEGYHTALMKGRYPVCCLFIELDPAAVDVNIHPSKREVKFHQEQAVRRCMAQAVREALLAYHARPAAGAREIESTRMQAGEPAAGPGPAALAPRPPAPPLEHREFAGFVETAPAPPLAPNPPLSLVSKPEASAGSPKPAPVEALSPCEPPERPAPVETSSVAVPPSTGSGDPLLKIALRLLGVVGRLYVVLESDRGLVLLDQHAAHERILFEQMLHRLEQGGVPSQRLLLPETVELSARDAQFLKEQLETLNRLGLGLSEFGERTFLLDAVPPFVRASNARRFVIEVLDELKTVGEGINTWRLGEQIIAKTVCRHAVKANDPLGGPELEKLVADLRHCAMPYTCPHGRPTMIEMNFRELEKKFGRTV